MNTDLARQIIDAHARYDSALANLRNAGAMSTDDARAESILESAGDAYVAAVDELDRVQALSDAASAPETPSEDPEGDEAPGGA
jgi:hypothetical protein